jgi:heme/copper-type cytochrome/quinol oxidase subunit 2
MSNILVNVFVLWMMMMMMVVVVVLFCFVLFCCYIRAGVGGETQNSYDIYIGKQQRKMLLWTLGHV